MKHARITIAPAEPIVVDGTDVRVLDRLAGGCRVSERERAALLLVLRRERERLGLHRRCPQCGACVDEACAHPDGAPLESGTTHAARRTGELDFARGR